MQGEEKFCYRCRQTYGCICKGPQFTEASVIIRELEAERELIRSAVADYIWSEGCSCCRGERHNEHKSALGALLRVPLYEDGSGFNFSLFRSER